MFGTILAVIIGICILMIGVVIVCIATGNYLMDGSWRWGVRDDMGERSDSMRSGRERSDSIDLKRPEEEDKKDDV